jgi:hypothetical protein
LQGPTGPTGQQGPQGGPGITGKDGTFSPQGSDAGGNTIEVVGSTVGPLPFPTGPATGTELPAATARCPVSGPDRQAYDGGGIITTTDGNGQPSTNDVVGIENSFPGVYVNQTEVDPLPLGPHTSSTVSVQPANAYEIQAVISQISSNDLVTVQAYVICGP